MAGALRSHLRGRGIGLHPCRGLLWRLSILLNHLHIVHPQRWLRIPRAHHRRREDLEDIHRRYRDSTLAASPVPRLYLPQHRTRATQTRITGLASCRSNSAFCGSSRTLSEGLQANDESFCERVRVSFQSIVYYYSLPIQAWRFVDIFVGIFRGCVLLPYLPTPFL